jgi:hypothetical protein
MSHTYPASIATMGPTALISEVQLYVFNQSSLLDFSITSRFVTGAGPTLKNPTRADVSMSSGVLDMKNIEAAVIATAAEHISTMVLRQCMASISLLAPENRAKRHRKV